MNAEILAVGTELLLGQIVNTNAQFLSQELAALGIGVYYQTVVGDNTKRLSESFHLALARADIVILTGGLGPTTDDLTRETVAEALKRPLQFDEDVWEVISARMSRFNRKIPENNRRQAMVPQGASVLENPNGTAPGLLIRHGEKLVVLLPGPPRELQPLFLEQVRPILLEMSGHGVILSRSLRVIGIGESALEERLADLISQQNNPTIALYAKLGELEIRLTAKADEETDAEMMIKPIEDEIRQRIGEAIYGTNQDTLPGALGQLLLQRGFQLALAESCTGGLLGGLITSMPGSSAYFNLGLVTYSNQAKQELLGVSESTLVQYGAVSEQCALEMARGVKRLAKADVSIAVTGIAGPDGGTPEKPVGTVFVAVITPYGEAVEKLSLVGNRTAVQERTAKTAINLARLALMQVK